MDIERLYGIFCESRGVNTDSRSFERGQMFFALKGENFDGGDYASQVLEKGACCAVVTEGSAAAALGDPRIVAVPDTLDALKALAAWHRQTLRTGSEAARRLFGESEAGEWPLPVLAITGTNGKTTTKELIRCVLAARYKVFATRGNFNNEVGVPLSLLSIEPGTELAVIEMGASHPEDLVPLLGTARPDLGLITNVGRAHLEHFGSFEGVQRAKGRMYDYISTQGGRVFVNADDDLLVEMASQRGLDTVPYGLRYQGCRVLKVSNRHPYLRIKTPAGVINTCLVGDYNAPNVLAALAVGEFFGVTFEAARSAIEAYVPSNNRSQMVRTGRNTLIVDAYNANPTSMAAALDNFASFKGYKIAMLGSMGELGGSSVQDHAGVLERVVSLAPDSICLVGEGFRQALEATGYVADHNSPEAPGLHWYRDSAELAGRCAGVRRSLVLVKGSRSQQMELCVKEL